MTRSTISLKAVGLARDGILEFPVTQAEIADAVGLSTVHVNRVMKSLSREKLISYRNHDITILRWPELQAAGQFDPEYLHWPDGSLRNTGSSASNRSLLAPETD